MRNLIVFFLLTFVMLSLPTFASGYWGALALRYDMPGGIRCNITSIVKTIQQGQTAIEPIAVWESNSSFPNTYFANFTASGTVGAWTTFDPNPLLVPLALARNNTTAIISVPTSQPVSIYTGSIFVNSTSPGTGNCSISMLVSVTAPPTPPTPPTGGTIGGGGGQPIVLDTEVDIESGSEQVIPGQRVYATITITKAGGEGTTVNVNLTYAIRDASGKTVDYKSTTVGITNIRKDIYYLTLPPDAPLGIYTFRAFVTYGALEDTSMATFQVVRTLPAAVLNIKNIEVPLMFSGQKSTITLELENTGDDSLETNSTFYFPEGFEPKLLSEFKPIESKSSEIVRVETTPQVFGLLKGFVSIKYGGRGITREFDILVLPSYILLIPLIGVILFLIFLIRRKKEKRYIGTERISRIRRLVRR